MVSEKQWTVYALEHGLSPEDACVYAYIFTHRFKGQRMDSYALEWIDRIKNKKTGYADPSTMKVWDNALKRCWVPKDKYD